MDLKPKDMKALPEKKCIVDRDLNKFEKFIKIVVVNVYIFLKNY